MKKIISIIIISLLVWHTCIQPVAAASPSIVIDGGAVAGGGIAGGTNAKGDITALLVSLVLASQGVSVSLASDSNISPLEFIKSLLEDYANLAGQTFESICDLWLSNVKILADGAITMGMDSCKSAYQFLSWLKDSNNIVADFSGDFLLINGNMCPIVYPDQMIEISIGSPYNQTLPFYYKNKSTTNKYAIFFSHYNNNYILVGVSDIRGQSGYFSGGLYVNGREAVSFGNVMSKLNNIYYGTHLIDNFNPSEFSIPVIEGLPSNILNSLTGFDIVNGKPENDSLVGDSSTVIPDDFNISDNNVNILNPGLDLSALAIQSGVNGIVQIKEYIDALIRSVNGIEDNVLKVNDGITGILQELPIDLNIYDSTSVDTDDDSGNGVSIIDYQQYPDAETTQNYLNNMTFDLTGVFPFCLPFDVYNLLAKLDVEPVTPHVHLSFNLPVLRDPLVFDLDFAQWNGVASVVRKMELLAFVVGLALITRNIIRG